MARSQERSLVPITAAIMAVTAAVNLVAYAAGWMFRGEVPEVIAYGNLGASVLELCLVLGLVRRRRGAWSFAVSVEGTLTIVNLFGLAPMLRAGAIGQASVAIVVARAVSLVLVIINSKEFK